MAPGRGRGGGDGHGRGVGRTRDSPHLDNRSKNLTGERAKLNELVFELFSAHPSLTIIWLLMLFFFALRAVGNKTITVILKDEREKRE
jgi:hypothetical protein